uniref:Uncharacterized protein n=1 Tax=Rhizochromulina marina TaxID=1034831 RepID=A0A7S2WFS7_9STRA|mmetsp:Transcript_23290/g.67971  ORF Transcript_23290/g.67971 Transcript_23290/m.67971 type:complete len:401 (+) Transcript_23290:81-1283(+)|eukprot:CAMPEP_0118973332 /NCGR_PEP_ID=MMETSP1173-20130426/9814_1 /TAXON_ID=1034831 /ORGANISM="Rhizochromulina marina cf, Strain CCMP1243" /LENGTH=400 /DNA_ID=CAMNT_0006922965 /DNA_START=52 /DNA_END=1254 /DNA_ORIENTATION=-
MADSCARCWPALLLALALSALPASSFVPLRSPARLGVALRAPPVQVFQDISDTRQVSDVDPVEGTGVLPVLDSRYFDIFDLLVQRAIQQLHRQSEKSRIGDPRVFTYHFNHTHLDGGQHWHSLLGMRVHFTDFLFELRRGTVHDILLTNPETGEVKTQTVNPAQVAKAIELRCMDVGLEWAEDLELLAKWDKAKDREEIRGHRRHLIEKVEMARELGLSKEDVQDVLDKIENLTPLSLAQSARQVPDKSPMRRLNLELLQRATTLLAIRSLQKGLAQSAMREPRRARELVWFDEFCKPWLHELTGVVSEHLMDGSHVSEHTVSDAMLDAMSHRPPVIISGTFVDPIALHEDLLDHRYNVTVQLADTIKRSENMQVLLDREVLERSLRLEIGNQTSVTPSI